MGQPWVYEHGRCALLRLLEQLPGPFFLPPCQVRIRVWVHELPLLLSLQAVHRAAGLVGQFQHVRLQARLIQILMPSEGRN